MKTKSEIYEEALKKVASCEYLRSGYGHQVYRVIAKHGCTLTPYEKALVADRGNLPFGYRGGVGDDVTIYTD